MSLRLFVPSVALLFISAAVQGQVGPLSSEAVPLTGTAILAVPLPAGPTSILTAVVVDTSVAGGDIIDAVVGDPNVVISLVTPSGTEITVANAQVFGYLLDTYIRDTDDYSMISSPFTMGGTHTLIEFPAGQPSGTYQIKANTSGAAAATGMILTYYPSSAVGIGVISSAPTYRSGDPVVLSAILFDGSAPIRNATVTATVSTQIPVQASIGSYNLISQEAGSSWGRLCTPTQPISPMSGVNYFFGLTTIISPYQRQLLFTLLGGRGAVFGQRAEPFWPDPPKLSRRSLSSAIGEIILGWEGWKGRPSHLLLFVTRFFCLNRFVPASCGFAVSGTEGARA